MEIPLRRIKMKITVIKALAVLEKGVPKITIVPMNGYIPINRYIDEAGFYALDTIKTEKNHYLMTIPQEEVSTKKTKILFAKIGQQNKFEPIIEDDLEELYTLAHQLMQVNPVIQ